MSSGIQLSSISRFSTSEFKFSNFNPQITTNQPCFTTTKPYSRRQSTSGIKCVAAKPRKKSGPKTVNQEAADLVRLVLRNINDQKPLVSILNQYVRMLRVEHCFLMFEELGKSDKWLQCLEVFRWMQKQRWYIADNGVYSKLISVMGRKGQTRMAMWLFSEMRNSGCRPDTSVYNSLITAHLHSRDKSKALEKAMGYFSKMKGIDRCKPNVVTYNILLRAYALAGNIDQVNSLFKDLEDSLITPDIFTFNGVMDAYGKNGMIREMEATLARMKSNQCKPDGITFNLLIDAYGKKQEFDKMEQVFKSFLRTKHKPTAPTFNSMITNYGKARLREKAELTFQKMKNMGVTPTYITHDCMITMYGYCDYVSRARDIFDEMVSSGGKEVKVSSLNAMLEAYCRNGLPTEADVLFETMCNLGINRDSTSYKLLYRAYTKANEKELLQKLMKLMDKDGIVPNKRFFLEALGAFGSRRTKKASAKAKTGTTDSAKPETAAATTSS